MSEGSNHKRSVKHSFSLYSGPFLKPVVVVFYTDLYTLEHSKDKNNISEQKKQFFKFFYTTYYPKMDITAFQIQPNKTDNRLHLCSTQAELLTVPPLPLCGSILALFLLFDHNKKILTAKLIAIMRQQQKITLMFFSCLLFFFLPSGPMMAAILTTQKRQRKAAFKMYTRKNFQLLSVFKKTNRVLKRNVIFYCAHMKIDINTLPLFLFHSSSLGCFFSN